VKKNAEADIINHKSVMLKIFDLIVNPDLS
jgi:hypothetical protein